MSKIYSFSVRSLQGNNVMLKRYRGKVLLIVNTASKCYFIFQYKELQSLYEHYMERGLEILVFPCNQFGGQDPCMVTQINKYNQTNYKFALSVFDKVNVNGAFAHPLYRYLTREAPGMLGTKLIKWNFTKFLISREGKPVKRYSPITRPKMLASDIEKLL
ncbi:glutathione peroxidase [Candidatus Vallotia lariciata]|uniref:glutathione peroxidase n=1 Tax=Candidatus Vallotia laricis TaxID=2018052 RepID=UPI001D01B27E|nr:glutathione peroxidase [Candidatus Vallotia lariciata]UDG83066.1 Hydroperoxy fatty acid reductase gpx1 [Candidatus Vallotia lariciata]